MANDPATRRLRIQWKTMFLIVMRWTRYALVLPAETTEHYHLRYGLVTARAVCVSTCSIQAEPRAIPRISNLRRSADIESVNLCGLKIRVGSLLSCNTITVELFRSL